MRVAEPTEDLTERTGAGSGCGSCVSRLRSLGGQAGWARVVVSREFQVVPGIRTFHFLPCGGDFQPGQPGQHVLVQSRIGGRCR